MGTLCRAADLNKKTIFVKESDVEANASTGLALSKGFVHSTKETNQTLPSNTIPSRATFSSD